MQKKIEGILPVLNIPFRDNDQIDLDSLSTEIDWVYQNRCNGICLAMVSELLRLTTDERVELTYKLAELNNNRGAVIISVGAESTDQALFYARHTEKAGCDAIMAMPPLTSSLPDWALDNYFCTLADEINLPLIVQDASGFIGNPISLTLLTVLLHKYGQDKILFKPEASPLGPNLSNLRDATEGHAKIFDGSAGISLVDNYRRGLTGTMPSCDILDAISALWQALEQCEDELIYALYFPICAIVLLQAQVGLDGFIATEKYILHKRGIIASARRRRPYIWKIDDETKSEVDRLLARLERAMQAHGLPPKRSLF